MARCPDCNKFVSMENRGEWSQEPEVTDDHVDAVFRVARECADCRTELKETTFEFSVPIPGYEAECTTPEGHAWELAYEDEPEIMESGGGRFTKNMIGADVEVNLVCKNCHNEHTVVLAGREPASAFVELV